MWPVGSWEVSSCLRKRLAAESSARKEGWSLGGREGGREGGRREGGREEGRRKGGKEGGRKAEGGITVISAQPCLCSVHLKMATMSSHLMYSMSSFLDRARLRVETHCEKSISSCSAWLSRCPGAPVGVAWDRVPPRAV